jgi:four helix bundle protein
VADELHREVAGWASFDRWSVGIQLVRAADSIGANIAEGVGRAGRDDRKRFLIIARGSIYETEHWLLRARARGLIREQPQGRLNELSRTINGLIKWAETGWRD